MIDKRLVRQRFIAAILGGDQRDHLRRGGRAPRRCSRAGRAETRGHQRRAQPAADDVDAERQRQPGLLQPPLAEIDHQVQAALAVEQPPLVDQQRGVDLAARQRLEDRRERRDRDLDADRAGRDQPQHQPGGRRRARDADPQAGEIGGRERPRRHHHRTVAAPHGRAVRQQLVARRRSPGRRRATRPPRPRRRRCASRLSAAVWSRRCVKRSPAGVDRAGAQRVEHERVVGVDRIGERDRGGAVVRVMTCGWRRTIHASRVSQLTASRQRRAMLNVPLTARRPPERPDTPCRAAHARRPWSRCWLALVRRAAPARAARAAKIEDVEESLARDSSFKVRVEAALILGRLHQAALGPGAGRRRAQGPRTRACARLAARAGRDRRRRCRARRW